MTDERIFIYCDDASHPRRSAVTNFRSVGEGRWTEQYASRAAQGRRESGVTLEGNEQVTLGSNGLTDMTGRDFRSRYQLACRRCRTRPVVAREETLFSALNKLAASGVSQISLGGLAASLRMQSER